MRKNWRQQPENSSQKVKHNLPVWTMQHYWQINPTTIPVPSTKTANDEWAKKQIWACIEILWTTTMKLFFQDPIPLAKAVRPHFQTRTITFPWSQKSILILLLFFFFNWSLNSPYILPKTGLSLWAIIFISRWCHLISRYLLSINKVNSLLKLDFLV